MSDESLGDNPRVMDVNKPGKGRVMTPSSRPIVSPVVEGSASDVDVRPSGAKASHRVIKPVSSEFIKDDKDENKDKVVGEPGSTDDTGNSEQKGTTEEVAVSDLSDSDEVNLSSSAEVDALASNAAEKREAKQKAEEEAKKQAELEAMIASKEYYVPISYGVKSVARWWFLAIILIVLIVAIVLFLISSSL